MNQGLNQFGAYLKAKELFDLVVADMSALKKKPLCYRLGSQQIGSADSICANIEEGYGRLSRAQYVRFLDFARGSARETLGRYERLRHWLNQEIVSHRMALADEIISILTKTIHTLQNQLRQSPPSASYIREEGQPYETDAKIGQPPENIPPSTLDTRHSDAY